MKFHYALLRTFCNATEDEAKVREAFAFLTGDGHKIIPQKATGHHGNPIHIFEMKLARNREIVAVLRAIIAEVGDEIGEKLETLIDDTCTLHLRIDKQKAYLKKLELGGDDCIIVKLKIATFPVSKPQALIDMREHIKAEQTRKAR